MTTPTLILKPGELHFGSGLELKTLLGSCVAVTLWHPRSRVGGMCHFVLPSGGDSPRYGDGALARLAAAIARGGLRPADFEARIFGGGNMFPGLAGAGLNVGERNARRARLLCARHGLVVAEEHVGGPFYRQVSLDLTDGRVGLRVENASSRGGV